jgi:hypothetical protein
MEKMINEILLSKTGLTKEEAQQIAQTTLMYIGGIGKLSAMLGATKFSVDAEGTLSFKFKMFSKANYVSFKLNGLDLYDVIFSKLGKYELKTVEEFNNRYFDSLKALLKITLVCI